MITAAEYAERGPDDMAEATGSTPSVQVDYEYNELVQRGEAIMADPLLQQRLTLPEIIHAAEGERHARLSQYAAESKERLIPDPELHRRIDNILLEMGL